VSPSHAICVYAEPLVRGRRVVVVGDASEGLGERLIELGARTVHVYDPDGDRAAAARDTRGLIVRELPTGEFDVRDGAFDVALVPDLGAADARGDLLARVRRLLGRGGAALIGGGVGSSERAVDYYELYDRVALQFSHVRMIAELPFAGVALADLGLEGSAPEVSVDTQLAGDAGAPERFYALAGQDEVRLADYAIVQLPAPAASDWSATTDARVLDGHAALAQAQLRATLLEAQLDELRAKVSRQPPSQEQADRMSELEARVAETSARFQDAETRAADHYKRAERFSHEARQIAEELSRERDRANALEGALGGAEGALLAMRARTSGAEETLLARESQLVEAVTELEAVREAAGLAEARLSRVGAAEAQAAAHMAEVAQVTEEHAAELGTLEESLRERARVVRELEHEVARREGIVRELLARLEEESADPSLGSSGATPEGAVAADELRAMLDAASMELARREGQREELAWRIAELEQHVSRLEAEQTELTVTIPPPAMARAPRSGPSSVGPDSQKLANLELANLQNELDILRQAMAQEHAARLRAESGEELERARTELARQATLLEQLSRELDARDRARVAEAQGRSVDRTEA
jgi:hypothetical protein